MNRLGVYKDFNAAAGITVARMTHNGQAVAALCRYTQSHNCMFFMRDAAFSYVNRGEKYMLVQKREYLLKSGDLLYIPPNSVVYTNIREPQDYFESLNVVPGAGLLRGAGGSIIFPGRSGFMLQQSASVKALFGGLIEDVARSGATVIPLDFLKGLETLSDEFSAGSTGGRALRESELESMRRALTGRIYTAATLAELARESNMSLAAFKRKFRIAFGETPASWVRNNCLQTAYFRLKTRQGTVAETSDYIGFDNLAHFSQAFKKYFKISPSEVLAKN